MKLFTLLLSWLCAISVSAQEMKHPGNRLDLKETAHLADGVCIAEFMDLGLADVGSPGASYYFNGVIKIRRGLMPGDYEAARCSYAVQTIPDRIKEEPPVLGKPFLMLGGLSGKDFHVTKMVEPTPENVQLVEEVLRARGIVVRAAPKPPAQTDAPPPVAQAMEEKREPKNAKPAPAPASDASPSPGHWVLIGALILAAIGLIWFLRKRRS